MVPADVGLRGFFPGSSELEHVEFAPLGSAGTALPAGLYKSLEPPFLSLSDEVGAPGLAAQGLRTPQFPSCASLTCVVPQGVSSTLKASTGSS